MENITSNEFHEFFFSVSQRGIIFPDKHPVNIFSQICPYWQIWVKAKAGSHSLYVFSFHIFPSFPFRWNIPATCSLQCLSFINFRSERLQRRFASERGREIRFFISPQRGLSATCPEPSETPLSEQRTCVRYESAHPAPSRVWENNGVSSSSLLLWSTVGDIPLSCSHGVVCCDLGGSSRIPPVRSR